MDLKFFGPETFLNPQFVWTQNFFEPKMGVDTVQINCLIKPVDAVKLKAGVPKG